MKSPIDTATSGGMCIGCGGCAIVAPGKIVLAQSDNGFFEAKQSADLSEWESTTILDVCPAIWVSGPPAPSSQVWGPALYLGKAHATDDLTRFRASSGGALTALATHQIVSGAVDAAVCTVAAVTNPLGNQPLVAQSAADLADAVGSRYSPAAPLLGLVDLGINTRKVAFVGKPCDVSAARALQAAGALGHAHIELFVSFLCAGTPSGLATEDLVEAMDVDPVNVRSFRYRGHGWPGSATAITDDGSSVLSYDKSWGSFLGTKIHDRCKYCADGVGLAADVVFGDAWEVGDDGAPCFEERAGESLVIVRTEEGRQAMSGAIEAGLITLAYVTEEDATAMQPYQVHRRRYVGWRLLGRKLAGGFVPRYGINVGVRTLARQGRPVRSVREAYGALRRTWQIARKP